MRTERKFPHLEAVLLLYIFNPILPSAKSTDLLGKGKGAGTPRAPAGAVPPAPHPRSTLVFLH
jgi:hypothetical protein